MAVARAADRHTMNAVGYIPRTGWARRDVPEKYGDDSTAHRRLRPWSAKAVWERTHRALLGMLERRKRIDWSAGLLDCNVVPAKNGEWHVPDR